VSSSLEGKVAIVTGAGSGIGRASAELLALRGARVLAADISEDTGRETVSLVRQNGGTAEFVRVDVAESAEVDSMVSTALDAFGGVDIVFANAGYGGGFRPLVEQDDEEIAHLLSVNLNGVLNTCRSAIPKLRKDAGASVVITSSICGLSGVHYCGAYNATKWAVIGITQTLALEHASEGIRVNSVAPGWVDTPMNADVYSVPGLRSYYETVTPLGRMGTPQDIANAVAFLCSDEAAWITGITLVVDGGFLLRQGDMVLSQQMVEAS
jgi:NAD(P)-dependent dehydrogenase (short-subunit alcohol dehydrogenase family)